MLNALFRSTFSIETAELLFTYILIILNDDKRTPLYEILDPPLYILPKYVRIMCLHSRVSTTQLYFCMQHKLKFRGEACSRKYAILNLPSEVKMMEGTQRRAIWNTVVIRGRDYDFCYG